MKRIIILLLTIVPFTAHCQKVITPGVEEKALSCVGEFCSLLTRWSNGERTLDSQIYALCSGNDCSAYDDINTMKETTLRNYLLGIQKKYPKSFQMQLSKPMRNNYKLYTDGFAYIDIRNSHGGLAEDIGYDWGGSSNITKLVAFKVQQKTPQGVSERTIIYDRDTGKITAFLNSNGTLVNILDAIYDVDYQKDYRGAIKKLQEAASNPRFSLKNKVNLSISIIYSQLRDYPSAIAYAEKSGSNYFTTFIKAEQAFMNKRYDDAIANFLKCEDLIKDCEVEEVVESYDDMDNPYPDLNFMDQFRSLGAFLDTNESLPYIHYCLGISHLFKGNRKEGISYLTRSANEGFKESAYSLYKIKQQTSLINENDMSSEDMIKWLKFAAMSGFDLAEFEYGVYKQYVEKKTNQSIYWYYETLNSYPFHLLAMACLGKICLESKTGLPNLGWKYLDDIGSYLTYNEKDTFQKYLKGYIDRLNRLTDGQFWIKSYDDVMALKEKYKSYAPPELESDSISSVPDDYNPYENSSIWVEKGNKASDDKYRLRQWYRKYKKDHPDLVRH